MKNILVFGGAGFIGSNLCHWILENTEDNVIAVDNLSGGFIKNMPEPSDRFLFIQEDACDNKIVNAIFNSIKADVCFALQAYAAEGRSNYIRNFIHANNTVSMANVINGCVNHKCKLIFTSSVAVYSGYPPFTESTVPKPIDEYGLSKWTTEKSIQIAGEQQDLDWCILRPRNVFGVRQSLFDTARNVMGIWLYQILNNQPMTIFGDGSNKRCFTAVEDILKPMYNAIEVPREIINIGSPVSYSIMEANLILQDITGYRNVEHLDARHEVEEAVCRIEKSIHMLHYRYKTSLISGLHKMWEWSKEQKMRPLQTPPPLEIFKTNHSSIK